MKYVISESQLDKAILKYFDELFQVDNINFHFPLEYDEDTGEEYEDGNRINYFIGDFDDGENDIFKWYNCDYFDQGSYARTICPTVDIETKYVDILDGYFGDKWIEPFKTWFVKNFDDPVKTVEWWGHD
jgi:hypothetical protein